MSFIVSIYYIFLYQPLFNLLVLLYKYIPGHDFGIAVIILTILVKIVLYPLGAKAIKSQKALSELQPKIKELQEKYKDNKEEQAGKMMELYKKEKINPFSGFLPLFIQFPVLIALYQLFWKGLQTEQTGLLYSFVPNVGQIDPNFFSLFDLSQPSLILAFIAGILQFIQVKMTSPKSQKSKGKQSDFSKIFQKQMLYFFPIITVLILFRMPSAIGLYWIVTTLFTIGQQYLIFKKQKSI